MNNIEDYIQASKDLFKQVFGEEIFLKLENNPLKDFDLLPTEVNNVTDGTFLDVFITFILDYGIQQAKNTQLQYILTAPKVKDEYKFDFSQYMESAMSILESETTLCDVMLDVKLKAIDWKGLDITTCHILATTPGIKEKFTSKWISYSRNRDTMLGLVLQSIFHYGFQYGMDTIVEPLKEKYYESIEKLKSIVEKKESEEISEEEQKIINKRIKELFSKK